MRVGILTYHWAYNFGANLQALSAQRFLERLGHNVTILNYYPEGMVEALYSRVIDSQVEAHTDFCNTYLNQSPLCKSETDLVNYCGVVKFDAILVGSDAVFRLARKPKREDQRFPNPFWLQWVTQLTPSPIVSALGASSMGTPFFALPLAVQKGIGQAIQQFDYVSVRDKWTKWMVQWLSRGRKRAFLCPDPVNVFNEICELPSEFSAEPKKHHKQYILVSLFKDMLSDTWIRDFVEIAHKQDLAVYSLPLPEEIVEGPVDRVIGLPLSPLEWFAWIQNAAGYMGVRFHAIVSSIVSDVPFVSFDNYQWRFLRSSSKTYDLCTQAHVAEFCLNDRLRSQLSPEQAFTMLFSQKQKRANTYAKWANTTFRDIVPRLLINKAHG